jgi:SAM-dependent methyltransferase
MSMEQRTVDLQLDRAHSARMYDYYLGGRTNFQADREAVGKILALMPAIQIAARENRKFMHRSTRFSAEQGIRQFLDVGTGIPTQPNLHEIAQAVVPDARVVYVDNDPIVLAHAQALLQSTPEGHTAYIQADLGDPESILDSPELRESLDLTQPVALSLNAVLHFITDDDRALASAARLKDALAPGSVLVITHGASDVTPQRTAQGSAIYRNAGTAVRARSRDEFAAFFAGWDMVEPGFTTVFRWRPDSDGATDGLTDEQAGLHAGVARKPAA